MSRIKVFSIRISTFSIKNGFDIFPLSIHIYKKKKSKSILAEQQIVFKGEKTITSKITLNPFLIINYKHGVYYFPTKISK